MAMAKLFIISAEGGAFLVHVDEDLAETAVIVLARAQIHLVTADDGLLGVALAPIGHLFAFALALVDDALHDLFSDLRGLRGDGQGGQFSPPRPPRRPHRR